MKNLAPITLFVYNRLYHTKETVDALQKNTLARDSDLFIYSDGPKNDEDSKKIIELRNYLKTIDGFRSVIIIDREKNIGLANSIITGITEIVNRFSKIIVLEDDLVTSPYFLSYMNQGLDMYENEDEVISIHGYVYPTKEKLPETFFIKGADCWGWATWARGWKLFEPNGLKLLNEIKKQKLEKEFNFNDSFNYIKMLKGQIEGRNDSWAVRWYASAFLANKLTLYPGQSLVNNIGFDGSGTHSDSKSSNLFDVIISTEETNLKPTVIEENKTGRKAFIKYFRKNNPTYFSRIRNKLKKIKKLRESVLKTRILFNYYFGSKNQPIDKKLPWIAKDAIKWLDQYLKKDMKVFEWGSGGSTLFIADRVKEIISIEHNYEWYLKTQMYLRFNRIHNCKYELIEAEPKKSEKYLSTDRHYINHNFEKYCKVIDNSPNEYFDLVFIDGRARPSCILHAVNKVKIGGYILLDNSEREEYSSGINMLKDWKMIDFSENSSTTSVFQKIK